MGDNTKRTLVLKVGNGFGNLFTGLRKDQKALLYAGAALDLFTNIAGKSGYDGTLGDATKMIDAIGTTASNGLISMGGVAGLVGLGMKANGLINTLFQTSGNSGIDAFMNSSLTPFPLTMINKFTEQQTRSILKDNNIWADTLGHYGGGESTVDDAVKKVGTYGGFSNLFGLGALKANESIDLGNYVQETVGKVVRAGKDMRDSAQASNTVNTQNYFIKNYSGLTPKDYAIGRNGLKLAREILLNRPVKASVIKIEIPEYIESFKNGGEINVIPDGALHAHKNNMDVEGITKKGIPVVDTEGNQQAEIEHSEIIFRLEVTEKLEKLEKEYYKEDTAQSRKDELALEAGKLLVDEILNNTLDNTNKLL